MADTPISVFISYSRTDSAFIDRLEADLRAYGFDTWVDRQHLEGGADWARQIEQQIVRCEALVVALSPDAITSTWVRREITFALNAGKHIIPIIARPVASTPIEIVNLQYSDLSADYLLGLQDLRVALLKTRTLPPPPRPAQEPQPLLTLPDVSDPLKGLVQIPPAPPAPNPDLNATFMQAQSALAHGNLDLAEALLGQIVEQQSDFGYGLAGEELQRVRKQLEPVRIERLRRMADDAHTLGAWGQEIGALRALAESISGDDELLSRLVLAEDCQKWAWLYNNARGFAQSNDIAATSMALTRLWEKAPYFGDPANITPPGLTPPSTAAWPPTVAADTWPPVESPGRIPSNLPTFVVQKGKEPGKEYVIHVTPYSIGRSSLRHLFLQDTKINRLHAIVTYNVSRGFFSIQDKKSDLGTYVNGNRVTEHQLRDGDVVQVGQTALRFRLPSELKR